MHWYPLMDTLLALIQAINQRRIIGRPVTGKIEGFLYESRDYRCANMHLDVWQWL